MDDLAARGVRFASCYTPNPVCVPAREAVVADRWAASIRATPNRPLLCTGGCFKPHPPFDPPRRYWDRYPAESVTLPEVPEEDRKPHGQLDSFLRTQNRSKSMDAPDEARVRA